MRLAKINKNILRINRLYGIRRKGTAYLLFVIVSFNHSTSNAFVRRLMHSGFVESWLLNKDQQPRVPLLAPSIVLLRWECEVLKSESAVGVAQGQGQGQDRLSHIRRRQRSQSAEELSWSSACRLGRG